MVLKLMEQIFERKIGYAEEFSLKNEPEKEIWQFYQVINLANALLKKTDPKAIKKNLIWKRLLLTKLSENKLKSISILRNCIQTEMVDIINANKLLLKRKEAEGYREADIDREDVIAITSFEIEDEE